MAAGRVRATFMGTSTILLEDGASSLLVDGFFSRPSFLRVGFGKIAPDQQRISEALSRAGITRLDALLVAHSHYDHVMDSPEVIKRVGGVLHGSESTLNVGRGYGLPESSMSLMAGGDVLELGTFTVRVYEGPHSPGDKEPGTIDAPLTTPTKAKSFRTGACFSFQVIHETGSLLILPSANFVPNLFDGLDVDAVYLGVGTLGAQPDEFRDDYWHHVVEATRPSLVVPVHWDDFFRPLDKPFKPLPPILDKFARTQQWLQTSGATSGIPVRFQEPFEVIAPLG